MVAEIICVGTELLLGDIVNTNAQYLSKELAKLGIDMYFQTVVGDNRERIRVAIDQAFSRSDLVIMTGGLGPTKDDITKTAGFREAMDDVEHGRVYHADSVDDMFKQILGCRMIQN